MKTESTISRERLASDMKSIISDFEGLLKATAGQADDKIQTARSRVEKALHSAKEQIEDLEHAAVEKIRETAKKSDEFVHENPWYFIGMSAGLGLIAGWLIGRK
jgi:ElaB/YqjD/DUF883 family membrane-anchored ribosome-binding protein